MIVRISLTDSVVTTLYSRIGDKNGQIEAKTQQLRIKDDSEQAYKTYIDSLIGEISALKKTNRILKGIAAILILITLIK